MKAFINPETWNSVGVVSLERPLVQHHHLSDNTPRHRWFLEPAVLIYSYYTEITSIMSRSSDSNTLRTLGGVHPSRFVKFHHKSRVKKVITCSDLMIVI